MQMPPDSQHPDNGSRASGDVTARQASLFRFVIFAFVFLMYLINTADRSALSIALPALEHDFHLGKVAQGWLASSFLWSYILLNMPSGVILDRKGNRTVGTVAVGIWSSAMIVTGFVHSLGQFIVTRILLGAGEAPTFPLGGKVLRDWARPSERGSVMTALLVGMQLGIGAGALGGAFLITSFGWRVEFEILGGAGLLWALAWLMVYPRSADPAPRREGDPATSIVPVLRSATFWSILITMCVTNYCNFLLISWMPTFFLQTLGVGLVHAGTASAACYLVAGGAAIGLSRWGESVISRRKNPRTGRPWLIALFLVGGSSICFLPLLTGNWIVVLLAFAIGCMGAANGTNIALLTDRLTDGSRIGTITGLVLTFSNLVGLLAPVVTGYVLDRTGSFTGAWLIGAGGLWIGAAVAPKFASAPIVFDRSME